MSKKILLSVILLIASVFTFNYVFAEDNMAQNAANTITDSVNKTQNTMQNAGNAVMDAGNGIMNAANNVVNGAAGAINNITEDRNTNTTPDTNNNNTATTDNTDYTATRTAGEGTLLGMNATTWTWIIMGLVAIAIIALVWYYSIQTSEKRYDD